jgi:hypothetical protein
MKIHIKPLLLLVFCLISLAAQAARVDCPQGLHWTFEGICQKNIDQAKEAACPQRSKLSRLSVTLPLVCVAEGKCPSGQVANAAGRCIDSKKNIFSLNNAS